MTKKDFEQIATWFGVGLRYTLEHNERGYWHAIQDFCLNAQEVNPRFDQERFTAWVRDVAEYRRDDEGRIVR